MSARCRFLPWVAAVILALPQTLHGQRIAIAVIAHPAAPADSLNVAAVRRIYLARQLAWSNGQRVHPVNLPATSDLRNIFSMRVLDRSPRSLAAYWNDLYFHGTQPPPVLESERAVVLYVQRTNGALGYVSLATAQAASDLKVLLILQ